MDRSVAGSLKARNVRGRMVDFSVDAADPREVIRAQCGHDLGLETLDIDLEQVYGVDAVGLENLPDQAVHLAAGNAQASPCPGPDAPVASRLFDSKLDDAIFQPDRDRVEDVAILESGEGFLELPDVGLQGFDQEHLGVRIARQKIKGRDPDVRAKVDNVSNRIGDLVIASAEDLVYRKEIMMAVELDLEFSDRGSEFHPVGVFAGLEQIPAQLVERLVIPSQHGPQRDVVLALGERAQDGKQGSATDFRLGFRSGFHLEGETTRNGARRTAHFEPSRLASDESRIRLTNFLKA